MHIDTLEMQFKHNILFSAISNLLISSITKENE